MEQGTERGMQTFDQALYKLYKEGKIDLEEALRNADSRNNLSLRIRLSESGQVGGLVHDARHVARTDPNRRRTRGHGRTHIVLRAGHHHQVGPSSGQDALLRSMTISR